MSGVEKIKSSLLNDVREIISAARSQAVRSVDSCRVQMYWHIGRRIFEEEQHGKDRADYGVYLIKNLAKQLEPEYGSGFSVRQLDVPPILSSLSNCERTAFAIELDTVHYVEIL